MSLFPACGLPKSKWRDTVGNRMLELMGLSTDPAGLPFGLYVLNSSVSQEQGQH